MTRRSTHYRTRSSSDRVDARFSVVEHLGNDPVATAPGSVLRVLRMSVETQELERFVKERIGQRL